MLPRFCCQFPTAADWPLLPCESLSAAKRCMYMQDIMSSVTAEVLEISRPRFVRPVTEEAWLRGCSAIWQDLGGSKDLDHYLGS
jgi:hypothetical protein